MASTGAPSKEYLVAQKEALRTKYAARNEAIFELRDLRFNRNAVYVPAKLQEAVNKAGGPFHAPHTKFLIRAAQGLLGARLPLAKRIPEDVKSAGARRVANRIEKWFNLGFYPRHFRRTLFQVTDSMAEGGYGIWKVRKHAQTWGQVLGNENEPDAKKYNKRVRQVRRDHFPIVPEHVATTTFYPVAPDGFLTEVFEITRRERALLTSQYEDELRQAGVVVEMDAPSMVGDWECVEYSNCDSWALMIENEVIKRGEHKSRLGRPPYYVAQFSPTGVKDPRYESEAIADAIAPLQKRLERWLTLKDYYAERMAAPGFKLETADAELVADLDEQLDIPYGPDVVTEVPMGRKLNPMIWAGTGQDLNQMWQTMASWMDDFSLAPVLLGKSTGRISAATQQGQIQLAKGIFAAAMEELAAACDEMDSDILYLIDEDLKADVPVQLRTSGEWLEIGPDDIDGDYHITNKLKPVIEMERIINGTFMMAGYDKGFLTAARIQEESYDIEDPDEEKDARIVEDILNGPEVNRLILAMLAHEIQADLQPPPPTLEEVMIGQAAAPPPGIGTPAATGGMPGGLGIPMVPGVQQPIAPGVAPVGVNGPVSPQAVPM